jgi:hypothetical protein
VAGNWRKAHILSLFFRPIGPLLLLSPDSYSLIPIGARLLITLAATVKLKDHEPILTALTLRLTGGSAHMSRALPRSLSPMPVLWKVAKDGSPHHRTVELGSLVALVRCKRSGFLAHLDRAPGQGVVIAENTRITAFGYPRVHFLWHLRLFPNDGPGTRFIGVWRHYPPKGLVVRKPCTKTSESADR